MDELLQAAVTACAEIEVRDSRVAEQLTERTVRYYVTLGLVRPPLRDGGRSLWTRDHMNDLIRVRRAQASGRSLKQIPRFRENVARSPFDQMNLARPLRSLSSARADESGWVVKVSHSLSLSGFTDEQPTHDELNAVRVALARLIDNN